MIASHSFCMLKTNWGVGHDFLGGNIIRSIQNTRLDKKGIFGLPGLLKSFEAEIITWTMNVDEIQMAHNA